MKSSSSRVSSKCAIGLLGGCALLSTFSGGVHAATADALRAQVIGGSPAGLAYPATGALIRDGGDASLACTATLVAPRLVLTAAHCLDGRGLSFTLESDALAPRDAIPVKRWRAHPDFSELVGVHDVAVAELSEAVRFVSPEELFDERALDVGLSVELVGYGPMTDSFTAARVKNVGSAVVERLDESEFVVGEAGAVENCGGDSGGPAFLETHEGRRVVGVTSRALKNDAPCSGGSVLTRLEGERAFVEDAIGSLNDTGAEAACSVRSIGGAGVRSPGGFIVAVVSLWGARRRSRYLNQR